MKTIMNIFFLPALCLTLAATSCLRPAEERADLDLSVGRAWGRDISVEVDGGLAAFTSFEEGSMVLWAQSPIIRLKITTGKNPTPSWSVVMKNAMPGSQAYAAAETGAAIPVSGTAYTGPTVLSFSIDLPKKSIITVSIAPPDFDADGPFRFAYISDIQGIDNRDAFELMNADPSIRFVLSGGDLTEDGSNSEINRFLERLATLQVPFYATPGNHDMGNGPGCWHDRIGRFNVHFGFRGTWFTLADSSNATIDPTVYQWLNVWLGEAAGGTHVFVTHYPPLDPFGMRNGSFRSTLEAAKLLALLARGRVDVTLYGHIHTFYSFTNAGIPAYISGGGGGIQGIINPYGRHFLVIDTSPGGIRYVGIVKVGR